MRIPPLILDCFLTVAVFFHEVAAFVRRAVSWARIRWLESGAHPVVAGPRSVHGRTATLLAAQPQDAKNCTAWEFWREYARQCDLRRRLRWVYANYHVPDRLAWAAAHRWFGRRWEPVPPVPSLTVYLEPKNDGGAGSASALVATASGAPWVVHHEGSFKVLPADHDWSLETLVGATLALAKPPDAATVAAERVHRLRKAAMLL